MAHTNDASKHNRSLLRKTKDKKGELTSIRGAKGQLQEKEMSKEEFEDVLLHLKNERQKDFRKRLLVFVIVATIMVIAAILILT